MQINLKVFHAQGTNSYFLITLLERQTIQGGIDLLEIASYNEICEQRNLACTNRSKQKEQ